LLAVRLALFGSVPSVFPRKRQGVIPQSNTFLSDRSVMGHFIASGREKLLFLDGGIGTQDLSVPSTPNEFKYDWLSHISVPVANIVRLGEIAASRLHGAQTSHWMQPDRRADSRTPPSSGQDRETTRRFSTNTVEYK
jgi:hypothetical protein